MIQIRQNIFETNSSSVHTMTICREDEYQDWRDGKTFLILRCPIKTSNYEYKKYLKGKKFIEVDDAHSLYNSLHKNEWKYYDFSEIFVTYEEFFEDSEFDLESYMEYYIDENTDAEYRVFGKYGYDG